jgi:ureidoglycolate lyase
MRSVKVKELSLEDFNIYGRFYNLANAEDSAASKNPIEFYPDLLPLMLGRPTETASFSICRTLPRPFVVNAAEYHSWCGEGILPLDGDVLIHVGPPTSGECPTDRMEVFRVPQGTMVALRPGVWHHAPFSVDKSVSTVIILPNRTYANDCILIDIPEKDQFAIEL